MSNRSDGRILSGAGFAIASAVLFGLSTPFAKILLGDIPPVLLAGLPYAGSGLGLFLFWLLRPVSVGEAPITRAHQPWLDGAVVRGGILGPVLLMSGLRSTPASAASLLLNLEGVFTALLAWFVFHEDFDRRIALGFALIMGGGVVLSWQSGTRGPWTAALGPLAITAACLCWAVDNNLTQKISGADPLGLAAIKGGVAGAVNVLIAFVSGAGWPSAGPAVRGLVLGFLGYGVSLTLFVTALRHLGTARTGASAHTHLHVHEPLTHRHPHDPDITGTGINDGYRPTELNGAYAAKMASGGRRRSSSRQRKGRA